MAKKKKTIREIANSFHVNTTEIGKIFGCGTVMADKIFVKAKKVDYTELQDNYLDSNKVRLSTVLSVMGISEDEFRRKISARETE